ncbi:hypothetical protein HY623_02520 [Candidatus Uhrbacteria bacterium]|nr:hypothetical protein [Candidatus Uhrbacteria bacterium]
MYYTKEIKLRAQELRKKGKTYSEIRSAIGVPVPKPTLSYWLGDIVLEQNHKKRIELLSACNLAKGRSIRIRQRRELKEKNFHFLKKEFENPIRDLTVHQKKLLLALLYLGEGGKAARRAAVLFGNSDPKVIRIFLWLMRTSYAIDESKFRGTVQCRADQNIKKLERFWSKESNIPLENFLKAQIDKRSIGRPTRKKDYRGVLRIDYYSANIFHELMNLSEIISEGL